MSNQMPRTLRQNSTEAEKRLWKKLRAYQLDNFYFRRQAPMGNYVVDFVCHKAKLIIELDGGQHALSIERDNQRSEWLKREGYCVFRFWNNEVMENMDGILCDVQSQLFKST